MVTRGTIEALVKCGAFSSTKARRSQLLQVLDGAVEIGPAGRSRTSGPGSSTCSRAAAGPPASAGSMAMPLPDVDELPDAELLKFEKELLGFYITSHPLTEHQVALEHYSTASTKEAHDLLRGDGSDDRRDDQPGEEESSPRTAAPPGMQMAIITLEDLEGPIDGTLFAETFAEVNQKYPTAVANESIVFVRGKVDRKRETPSLLVNEVIPIAEAAGRLTTAVARQARPDPPRAGRAAHSSKALLKRHKGNTEVFLQVTTPTRKVDPAAGPRAVREADAATGGRPGDAARQRQRPALRPGHPPAQAGGGGAAAAVPGRPRPRGSRRA